MPRRPVAYLSDIIEACDAIQDVLSGVDLTKYQQTRAIRSSVEREFITIGEAISVLGRVSPGMLDGISHDRMIVGFRNVLTHDYAAVDDETVFALAQTDMPVLRQECAVLLEETGESDM